MPKIPWVSNHIFYGWVIVAVGMVGQFSQGISVQGFSSYLGPLQQDFGWNRALLAGPRSVTQVQNSVFGPLEGYLIDKFGPRKVVMTGSFILGSGFIIFGFTNSIWLYFIASMVIALGTGLQGLLVLSVTVNNWFARKRTLANSVMLLGFAMAGIFGVPILVIIQSSVGWQESAIASGLFVWIVGIPCSLLLRTKPELYGLLPDGDPQFEENHKNCKSQTHLIEYDFTLKEALKTKAFWLIAIGSAIGNLGMGAAQTHLFLHLELGLDLERSSAALVWTIASISNVPSRLIGGVMGDRFPKNIMLGIATLSMSISIFILGIATSIQMAFIYAFLYGIGWGIRTPVMNAIQGEYFGRSSQGIIRGWLQSVSLPFTIAAPVIAGYVADKQGDYEITFIATSIVMLLGAILLFIATRPIPKGN